MDHVNDHPGRDDPVWEYLLRTRLLPYIPVVRQWWADVENFEVNDTGIMDIPNAPPGLQVRFTRTAIRSPIKGVQAFPFVPSAYLQLTGIQGGSVKLVSQLCLSNKFTIDEFTIVCKSNLPSTYNQGQFLAFVPTAILEDTSLLGKWVYLTSAEIAAMIKGTVPESVVQKGVLKI